MPIPKLVTGFARSILKYLTGQKGDFFVLSQLREDSLYVKVHFRLWLPLAHGEIDAVPCLWTAEEKSTQSEEEKTAREERKLQLL